MERHSVDERKAFAMLQAKSRNMNRKPDRCRHGCRRRLRPSTEGDDRRIKLEAADGALAVNLARAAVAQRSFVRWRRLSREFLRLSNPTQEATRESNSRWPTERFPAMPGRSLGYPASSALPCTVSPAESKT